MGGDGPQNRPPRHHDQLSALPEIVAARRGWRNLGSEPAWIAYETEDGKRFEKAATAADTRRAKALDRGSIEPWYPEVPLGPDREMYIRCALQLQGIASVADFYTPRNLQRLRCFGRKS